MTLVETVGAREAVREVTAVMRGVWAVMTVASLVESSGVAGRGAVLRVMEAAQVAAGARLVVEVQVAEKEEVAAIEVETTAAASEVVATQTRASDHEPWRRNMKRTRRTSKTGCMSRCSKS